jgi:hypothetical protein
MRHMTAAAFDKARNALHAPEGPVPPEALQAPQARSGRHNSSFYNALRNAANGPYRYLVLLSHMRSHSSVLAHVLGSSPSIQGSGETQVRFRNLLDLWRMRRSIRESTGEPLRGPWLLDKVLHNDIRPIDRFVGQERMRVLIFLRHPDKVLASQLNLARERGPDAGLANAQTCCDYYVERLHRLREDGLRYGRRALYFDAEVLIQHPQRLLTALAQWLELPQPLSTEYRLVPRSGKEGYGDWLPNIRAGRVLGVEASTTLHQPIPVELSVLAEARGAYERCRTALMRTCEVGPLIGPAPRTH